jgi:predicted transcriptional regulator
MVVSSVVFRNMSSEEDGQPVAGDVPGDAAPGPEPGPAEPDLEVPRQLADAKAMRALAHPVRMALLELFAYHQTLTATQASELLGESPANCAFHLRTLAKYGFVREAGGGRGRQRPWTLTDRSLHISQNQDDPQAALAAGELGRALLDRWLSRAREVHGAAGRVPGWETAAGWALMYLFLTADETKSLRAEIGQLLSRYEPRYADPALRPAGALPVEWAVFAAPRPGHDPTERDIS